MTTKLQPTNLDETLNYSVNQLSANTILDGGVDILVFTNSAYTQANAAFARANTGGSGTSGTNNARSMINSYIFGS